MTHGFGSTTGLINDLKKNSGWHNCNLIEPPTSVLDFADLPVGKPFIDWQAQFKETH